MSQWYYARDGVQQGPVPVEQFVDWIKAGNVGPNDMVWREGKPQWVPLAQERELQAYLPSQGPSYGAATSVAAAPIAYASPDHGKLHVSPRVLTLLRQTGPWARFMSVLLFVGAGFMLLAAAGNAFIGAAGGASGRGRGGAAVMGAGIGSALFNVVAAILYAVPGIYLWRYATGIGRTLSGGRQVDFENALDAQRSFWKFSGIASIVLIAIVVLAFVVLVAAIGTR